MKTVKKKNQGKKTHETGGLICDFKFSNLSPYVCHLKEMQCFRVCFVRCSFALRRLSCVYTVHCGIDFELTKFWGVSTGQH